MSDAGALALAFGLIALLFFMQRRERSHPGTFPEGLIEFLLIMSLLLLITIRLLRADSTYDWSRAAFLSIALVWFLWQIWQRRRL